MVKFEILNYKITAKIDQDLKWEGDIRLPVSAGG